MKNTHRNKRKSTEMEHMIEQQITINIEKEKRKRYCVKG